MSTSRPLLLTLAVLIGLSVHPTVRTPAAAEEAAALTQPMHQLGRLTEDALHWLLRNDFTELQHVGIELVRISDLNLSVAQTQGLSPRSIDLLVDMRDEADELREEAAKEDLKDAAKAYGDLVDVCMKCHVEELEQSHSAMQQSQTS